MFQSSPSLATTGDEETEMLVGHGSARLNALEIGSAACPNCDGSGIKHVAFDGVMGACLVPCEHCASFDVTTITDRAFQFQVAASAVIAASFVAGVQLLV